MVMKPMLKPLTKLSTTLNFPTLLPLSTKSHLNLQLLYPLSFVLFSNQSFFSNKLKIPLILYTPHHIFSSAILSSWKMSMSATSFSVVLAGSTCAGLKSNHFKLFPQKDTVSWSKKTVSNGSKVHCMKTWNPINNKKFETLSYLPPLSDESIAKEIDYMIKQGWIPCLEFDEVGYVHRENSRMPNYYDGRYWTLWKLPMFGCNDSAQVLNEIHECKKAYPSAYIRCLAFNNVKQAQCMSFLIQKPNTT